MLRLLSLILMSVVMAMVMSVVMVLTQMQMDVRSCCMPVRFRHSRTGMRMRSTECLADQQEGDQDEGDDSLHHFAERKEKSHT